MKELTTRVDQQMNCGKFCLAVSLDISNAFNTAKWGAILAALDAKDLPRDCRVLVRDYFRDR